MTPDDIKVIRASAEKILADANLVANGLLSAGRPEVELGLVPIGSANDYARSLGFAGPKPPADTLKVVDVGIAKNLHKFRLGLWIQTGAKIAWRQISIWNQEFPGNVENGRIEHIRNHDASFCL